MHFNLEEQEQLAQLKGWWSDFGKYLLMALAAGLVVFAGYYAWGLWQKKNAEQASVQYETLIGAVQKQDINASVKHLEELQSSFSSTSYAGMASLIVAQLANSSGNIELAEKHLKWAVDRSASQAHADIAKARLVSLFIDQQRFDDALKLTDAKVSKPFKNLMLERKGDVYLAQGKWTDAKTQYQLAWDDMAKNPDVSEESRQLLRVKMEAVGGKL